MTVLASFDVMGIPRPQGSKQPYTVNGHGRVKDSAGTAGVQWRAAVAHAARTVADKILDSGAATELVPPFTGALSLEITFRFPMPASRPKWMKVAGTQYKTTAPDTSKLCRSAEDALTAAGLIRDDALIAQLHAHKYEVFDQWTGATITIRRL